MRKEHKGNKNLDDKLYRDACSHAFIGRLPLVSLGIGRAGIADMPILCPI